MAREERETETSAAAKVSSWPLFVALGLAVGEVGVVMAIYPLAIGGLGLLVRRNRCNRSVTGST